MKLVENLSSLFVITISKKGGNILPHLQINSWKYDLILVYCFNKYTYI